MDEPLCFLETSLAFNTLEWMWPTKAPCAVEVSQRKVEMRQKSFSSQRNTEVCHVPEKPKNLSYKPRLDEQRGSNWEPRTTVHHVHSSVTGRHPALFLSKEQFRQTSLKWRSLWEVRALSAQSGEFCAIHIESCTNIGQNIGQVGRPRFLTRRQGEEAGEWLGEGSPLAYHQQSQEGWGRDMGMSTLTWWLLFIWPGFIFYFF